MNHMQADGKTVFSIFSLCFMMSVVYTLTAIFAVIILSAAPMSVFVELGTWLSHYFYIVGPVCGVLNAFYLVVERYKRERLEKQQGVAT